MGDNTHTGRWTNLEHNKFIQGLRLYGKNWKKIQQLIGTRTGAQVRSHAQKFFSKIQSPNNKQSPITLQQKSSQMGDSNCSSISYTVPEYSQLNFSYYVKCMYNVLLKSNNAEGLVYKLVDCKEIKINDNNNITGYNQTIKVSKFGFQPYKDQNKLMITMEMENIN